MAPTGPGQFVESTLRDLATLAGIRDTWQTKNLYWREACAQAEALRFYPASHLLSLEVDAWSAALAIGEILLTKNAERVQEIMREAHQFSAGDLSVVVLQWLGHQ